MSTVFINLQSSKTFDPHIVVLNLAGKVNVKIE